MAEDAYGAVRKALRRWGNLRSTEGGWLARCPVHDDRQGALLVVAAGGGRVELDCLGAGCDPQDIAAALRLSAQHLVVPAPDFEDGPGWVWPGYVPAGGLTLIDAEEGIDPFALALDVAARVSSGTALPDGQQPVEPRTVAVLTGGAGMKRVHEVVAACGADPGRVRVLDLLSSVGRRGVRLPADLEVLNRQLAAEQAALLVVDVMLACPHRTPVEEVLDALARLSEETGLAVVATRGASKRAGWLASRRAQAAVEAVDPAAVHLAITGPQQTALVPLVSRQWSLMGGLQFQQGGRARPVVWGGRCGAGVDQVLEQADLGRRRPASAGAHRFLRTLLARGPQPAREVMAAAASVGLAPRTVQRARRQLGVVATKTGEGWVLALPPQDGGW
ncbi:AAA family ATPase [Kitasatospora sp. RB6PN24]|uniref:AAA family ATPase n=1 Tax=Kitasatospora humi TaxID=2893891 RepID=UPI001E3F3545|nr:AAA family ATPase [Kitasatospora humi]MCC9309293.1 AAA family ATPase [Kitasatospora humi]